MCFKTFKRNQDLKVRYSARTTGRKPIDRAFRSFRSSTSTSTPATSRTSVRTVRRRSPAPATVSRTASACTPTRTRSRELRGTDAVDRFVHFDLVNCVFCHIHICSRVCVFELFLACVCVFSECAHTVSVIYEKQQKITKN